MDKRGDQLAAEGMVDRVDTVVKTVVGVVAGATAGAATGERGFKTPVVRSEGILLPGHTSRMEICRRV